MPENEHCTSPTCGCNLTSYGTPRKCPSCGAGLRLLGRLERGEFRLACSACGYTGPLLAQEELRELL
ncbi:MAG: RNA-binding protein [Chloroflexi bacterium]|nr:RNA-binding protein [Chloroflexota bacterium]